MFNVKPVWFFPQQLGIEVAIKTNRDVIENTGGKTTLPEDVKINILDSALNTPYHLHKYVKESDIVTLATRLCYRVAKAHAFDDGNKRTAFLLMLMFLNFNAKIVNKNVFSEMGPTLFVSFLAAYAKDIGNFDKCMFGITIKEAVEHNNEENLKSLLRESITEKSIKQAFFENQKNKQI